MLKKEDFIRTALGHAYGGFASGGIYDDVCDGDCIEHVEVELRSPGVLYGLTITHPNGRVSHYGHRQFHERAELREYLDRNICRGAGEAVVIE